MDIRYRNWSVGLLCRSPVSINSRCTLSSGHPKSHQARRCGVSGQYRNAVNRVRKWGRTKGGVVCLRVTQRAGRVHLAVADNGCCGIEDKIYRKIEKSSRPTILPKAQEPDSDYGYLTALLESTAAPLPVGSSTRAGKSGTTFRLSLPASKSPIANLKTA